MDRFEAFLKNEVKNKWHTRALTDKSYKSVYQKKYKRVLDNKHVNTDLATYGDAVLKLALCEILMDRTEKLSEVKSLYERDATLVLIGEHYRILDHLRFDKSNPKIPQDYFVRANDKDDHKYIATAVEAVLGAIYRSHRDMKEIITIVRGFVNIAVQRTIKAWYDRLHFPPEMDEAFLQALAHYEPEVGLTAHTLLALDCEDGELNLLRVLFLCEEVERVHRSRGIAREVTDDTLRDIVYWTKVWSGVKGRLYLGELHWLHNHLTGRLFCLGRLQFEISAAGEDIDNHGIAEGDSVLAVHIPRNGRLDPLAVTKSFDRAREFFAQHYGDLNPRAFTCSSWLLDKRLQKYLKAGSNILQFAALFDTIREKPSDDVIRYVFGWDKTREDLPHAKAPSAFAERVQAAILSGEQFYSAFGVKRYR